MSTTKRFDFFKHDNIEGKSQTPKMLIKYESLESCGVVTLYSAGE